MSQRLFWKQTFVVLCVVALPIAVYARSTKCTMRFSLEGWSLFYQTASGSGTITCDNGQTASVLISAKGGGLTFGTSKIVNGTGTFSDVYDIEDVFGTYAAADAHAGMIESAAAQVVTKGTISLALSGTGKGVNLGFGFGKYEISLPPCYAAQRRVCTHRCSG